MAYSGRKLGFFNKTDGRRSDIKEHRAYQSDLFLKIVVGVASVAVLVCWILVCWKCRSFDLAGLAFSFLLVGVAFLHLGKRTFPDARNLIRDAESERLVQLEKSLPGLIYQWRIADDGSINYVAFAGNLLTVLGLTSDEALRDPEVVFAFLVPADRARRGTLIKLCSETEAGYSDQFGLTIRNGPIWVRCTCTYYRDANDSSLWTSLWMDVTEQQQARELAEAGNQAKTELLANVSHEFRTPLNAIIGFNELLLDGQLSNSERRYVNRAADAASMLLTLVNQIVGFSKSVEHDVSKAVFSLQDLLEASTSLITTAATKKGVKLDVSVAPDVPMRLQGDPEKIKQVLVNLLSNAVKFIQHGSIGVWVTRLDHQGSTTRLRFAVVDSGMGIAQESIKDLFNRFSQVGIGAQYGGAGLGLAISQDLVRKMGGEIGATSALSVGSTFWFEVPLDIADASTGAPEELIHQQHAASQPLKILVAEDFEPNRELITTLLESAGHEVHAVCDGADAIVAACENDYALIFMDVQMPRVSGLAAAAAIRDRRGSQSTVPIVALTAGTRQQEIDKCLAAGMTAYVAKPFSKDVLLKTVNRWAQAEPPEAKVAVDRDVLHTIERRHGAVKLAGYLETFFADVRNASARLDAAPPRDEVGRIAHSLVGSAGQLGFKSIYDAARELMIQIGDEKRLDHLSHVDRLQHQLTATLAQAGPLTRELIKPSLRSPAPTPATERPKSEMEDA